MNRINQLQEILFYEINKINKMETIDLEELKRSNAISKNAGTYLKSIDTQLKIKEISYNNMISEETIKKDIGVIVND